MKRKITVIILILMVIIFLFNILSHKKIDLNGVYKHNTYINNIEIYYYEQNDKRIMLRIYRLIKKY